MTFAGTDLSDALKEWIDACIREERFPHASIVSGPNGEECFRLAQHIAEALVCSGSGERPCMKCSHCLKSIRRCHPDIAVIERESGKKEIQVDQIRNLVRDAVIMPNEAACKIYIVKDADTMNHAAQNAFLKLLEEPPSYAVFMLLTENTATLLQTVRSRCSILRVEGRTTNSDDACEELTEGYLGLLKGASELTAVEFCLKMEAMDKASFAKFLEEAVKAIASELRKNALTGDRKIPDGRLFAAEKLMGGLMEMQYYNVGPGHLAGRLAAVTAEILLMK